MTIYNINKGIGWASSGVEYAQAYRASIFRKLGLETKFIFTDMFQNENIAHFTKNIGFEDEEIIWLYSFFTDLKMAPTTYRLEDFQASLHTTVEVETHTATAIRYRYTGQDAHVIAFFKKDDPTVVQRVEYLSRGKLIRKDYYSYTRMFSEYYAPDQNTPKLYRRVFYNENGSVAYEENCSDKKSLYRFPDALLYSKEELIERMLQQLHLGSQDILLVDRSTEIGQAVLRNKGDAKVAVVVHAEHYSDGHVTEDTILWNNFYEYQFTNAGAIDAFITSTDAQTQTLAEQFRYYQGQAPKVITIPVGSLDQLAYPEQSRRPFSTLTCSRLATEKHIDWLVKGVVLARESLPDLVFDIYGEGGQRGHLQQLIEEHQAQDYIRLKGHQDLKSIYQNYEVYLSASTSEGFGLTLMEAIGSGLAMIGLDVPYGNQTFIENEKNGYLIPRLRPDAADAYAKAFAEKLIAFYQQAEQTESFHQASYRRAEDFLTRKLEEKWMAFIQEVAK
ncbi:accessory Sec system glycosyltransferase GtfA [Streptococcus suis]|uniref:accessory Sec system glycosyltransferase GtfA n=1 Tax=Streptococcus suis TaxID=1307 RepID=UPI00211D5886|nr:accessory Sec system glycosyltransferase GtfA [Streptococcus suis]UUM58289.1 accessory Sec system glycosyltransferase GtfA [Streptococcus suis]